MGPGSSGGDAGGTAEGIEAGGDDDDVVGARREGDGVVTGGVRCGVFCGAGAASCGGVVEFDVDGGVGDDGAGGIGDEAAEGAFGGMELRGGGGGLSERNQRACYRDAGEQRRGREKEQGLKCLLEVQHQDHLQNSGLSQRVRGWTRREGGSY